MSTTPTIMQVTTANKHTCSRIGDNKMLHKAFTSDIPYFDGGCFKKIEVADSGMLRKWSKITEIETDDSGHVIRVRLVTCTLTKSSKSPSGYKFQTVYKDYSSKRWMTSVMREFAHIAAQLHTRRLL